jgi:hypothetical protein
MELLGDVGQVEGRSDSLGDSVKPRQDGCMYCAKCTMCMEIILGAPDGTPR